MFNGEALVWRYKTLGYRTICLSVPAQLRGVRLGDTHGWLSYDNAIISDMV
ncbi:hypothetical protein SAMN05216337_105412 [Bradyrhizobium brasilense]|uniref:Uncharacterized protein n=1 Tax=Bradyrhizobium brasilense TaxID=1419277 RepID=A0A1G7KRU2_9BRAD|nr:hypothetical protein SAMN05216337_105412 [Bradyrhizobium brasilense]